METRYKKISDFFNPITNPAGGAPVTFGLPTKKPVLSTASLTTTNSTPQNADLAKLDKRDAARRALSEMYGGNAAPWMTQPKKSLVMPNMPVDGPMSRVVEGPIRPSLPAGGSKGGGNLNSSQSPALFGGQTPAPAPKTEQSTVPPQWMRPDGTMKTPEEIAAEVAGTLKGGQGPDIGKLAGDQFGGQGKSAVELAAEAAQINNVRNDIAVGENDPYKVAAASGIAYTPQELQAIEKAYAGIYDPAITTALAKVEEKQNQDAAAVEAKNRENEIRLQAELDASAPFTLGQDQVRYGSDGKPLAVGLSSDSGGVGTGVYTPGSNPTVDAFVKGIRSGAYKASDIPDEYKALVAQGMAATQPAISETSTGAVSVINELLANPAIDRLAGLSSIFPILPGGEAAEAATLAKQLKGILSLENREQLKGSGAISDFEFKVLGQAASALGINDDTGRTSLSEEDFKFQLDKLKLKLEVGETALTDDELLYLRDERGYTPEAIRQYNLQQSFGSVGNTSASTGQGNRPQRNNNPGNVKQGGLADPLAVGVDDQGHLIFPDAATGFKAMRADILAKINGNSRFLPPNPTIAQLGKVYAEDQNWPNSVSRLLGVSPNTPTANIPIDQLVQAIATQEGFYA